MHNGRVGCNRSSHNIIGIGKVDDDDLILVVYILANTNEVVGFQGESLRVMVSSM